MGSEFQDIRDQSYLTGKLLLAMPSIGDVRFHRSVIYLGAHDENGAMGLVVNAPARSLKFGKLLDQLGIPSDINIDLPVLEGGPVEPSRGFLLHSGDYNGEDTVVIDEDFSITGTTDALEAVAKGKGPNHALFILGYAGWTPGQLEQELKENAWLVTDPDPALIFEADVKTKWDRCLSHMGLDAALLSSDMGRA